MAQPREGAAPKWIPPMPPKGWMARGEREGAGWRSSVKGQRPSGYRRCRRRAGWRDGGGWVARGAELWLSTGVAVAEQKSKVKPPLVAAQRAERVAGCNPAESRF